MLGKDVTRKWGDKWAVDRLILKINQRETVPRNPRSLSLTVGCTALPNLIRNYNLGHVSKSNSCNINNY